MNRLPLPQNDPHHGEHERQARAMVDATAEALRRVDADLVPSLVVSLVRSLALPDPALDAIRRAIDGRLAWGVWPGEPLTNGDFDRLVDSNLK